MATYEEIYGKRVEVVSSDPSNLDAGQIWYNSTAGALKGYVLAPYHNVMKERYCHLIEQDALYAKHLPELNKETQDVQLMHVTLTKLSQPMVNAVLAQVIPDLIHN